MTARPSDVWTVADLANLLHALALATRYTGGEYAAGYRAALATVAVALGLGRPGDNLPTGGEGFRW